MKLSEFITKLQKQLEESGDLEVIKVNTEYENGYAVYRSDNAPDCVASTGEDFGFELEEETFIIW